MSIWSTERFKIFKNNDIEALENEINEYMEQYVHEVNALKIEHDDDATIIYMCFKPSANKVFDEERELEKKMRELSEADEKKASPAIEGDEHYYRVFNGRLD